MENEPERSRQARAAAEAALIRVVHHYGGRPEFVVLGGLVPELLCSSSGMAHAGTTDVDVQVDLEIACGSVNAVRLEQALKNAEFTPTDDGVWRWSTSSPKLVIKFELLADSDSDPAEAVLRFEACESLGAVNLRGTGFASRDVSTATLRGKIGEEMRSAEVNITGLAGFCLRRPPLRGLDGSRRIGTTSRSCCCTTTPVGHARRRMRFGRRSPTISRSFGRRLTISRRTFSCRCTRARRRTPRRCASTTPSRTRQRYVRMPWRPFATSIERFIHRRS